jgi:hypothetical protein
MPLTITTINTIDDLKGLALEKTAKAKLAQETAAETGFTPEQQMAIEAIRESLKNGDFGCNTSQVAGVCTQLAILATGREIDFTTDDGDIPRSFTIIKPTSAVKEHGHGYKVGKPALALPGGAAFRSGPSSVGTKLKNDWEYGTPEDVEAFFADVRKPHTLLKLVEDLSITTEE